MRKRVYCLICLLALCMFCACGNDEKNVIKADSDTFVVNITNCTTEDIYEINYEYYLGQTPIGGGGVCNADGSAIERGDTVTKDFMKIDFPENAQLSDFGLEIFVVDQGGNEYPCYAKIDFVVGYGMTYEVELVGDFSSGFEIELIEE